MTELNEFTYTAIITINMPGSGEAVEVHVKLASTDQLDGVGAKLLKDCTIAELRQFAAELEADVWAQYDQITLRDVVDGDEGELQVQVMYEGEATADDELDWLTQSLLVLPADVTPMIENTSAEDIAAKTIAEERLQATSDKESDQLSELVEIEEIPVFDENGEDQDSSVERSDDALLDEIVTHEPEREKPFEITVLDSEPVHEEREAAERRDIEDDDAPTAASVGLAESKGRTAGERARLNDPMPHACDVLIDEEAFRGSQAHALTSLNREVAGVLVGPHPEKQPDGRYVVHITDYIIAKHTRMQGASVTYTPESWRYVNDVMMSRYPEEECVIVGWYHTHPGFGIFLSNMDLFIHHNFFTQKWHLALVLDPVGKRSGFFTWDRKQKEVMAYPFPWPYWAHRSW